MIEARAVHHIGIAVRELEEHRDFYERVLGATYEGTEEIASQKVRVAFYRIGEATQGVRLELLEPTAPDSPVAKFIAKRGEGVHHIAYAVADLDSRLAALAQAGTALIDEAARAGAHHTRIAFLHPKSSAGVLTELVESRPPA